MIRLLFSKKNGLLVLTDQEVFHPHVEDPGQGQEIIHCGQALPVLPFVNGLRVLEAEVGLQLPHAHARIAAATLMLRPVRGRLITGKSAFVIIIITSKLLLQFYNIRAEYFEK